MDKRTAAQTVLAGTSTKISQDAVDAYVAARSEELLNQAIKSGDMEAFRHAQGAYDELQRFSMLREWASKVLK